MSDKNYRLYGSKVQAPEAVAWGSKPSKGLTLSKILHPVMTKHDSGGSMQLYHLQKRVASKPKPQVMGQLPADRLHPGLAFDCTGADYAGPFSIKSGHIRKTITTKAYVTVFVCFATKAIHLDIVSDLMTAGFIATLKRFIARRGKPSVVWSDHGTKFMRANKELQELLASLCKLDWQSTIMDYCTTLAEYNGSSPLSKPCNLAIS